MVLYHIRSLSMQLFEYLDGQIGYAMIIEILFLINNKNTE